MGGYHAPTPLSGQRRLLPVPGSLLEDQCVGAFEHSRLQPDARDDERADDRPAIADDRLVEGYAACLTSRETRKEPSGLGAADAEQPAASTAATSNRQSNKIFAVLFVMPSSSAGAHGTLTQRGPASASTNPPPARTRPRA